MKLKLALTTLEGLDDALHALYEKQADGTFRLDLDGYQDPGALLRAKEHEKAAHAQTKELLTAAQTQLDALQEQVDEFSRKKAAKGAPDALEQLEESWKGKLKAREDALNKTILELTKHLEKTHRDDVALRLATDLSDSPDLLVPLIEKRLQFELGASGPETRVLDTEGKLSALTLDELRDEFKANPKYAAVIRGSKASGGGAANNGKGASGPVAFGDMTEAQRVALFRQSPADFNRLSEAHRNKALAA